MVGRLGKVLLVMVVLVALGACTTVQGAFYSYGSTRACYGDAVETRTATLGGGGASWYNATSTCDYSNTTEIATFVQIATTLQVYNPYVPGWVNCTYTKIDSNNTGLVSYNLANDYFQGGICTGPGSPGNPPAGYQYATNSGHVVRVNGADRFTNKAAVETST